MKAMIILVLLISSVPTLAVVPGARELKLALASDQRESVFIRLVHCVGFPEEPTEFECGYERLVQSSAEYSTSKSHWQKRTAIIAIDNRRWVLLDESIVDTKVGQPVARQR